jgi:hypothetical protein
MSWYNVPPERHAAIAGPWQIAERRACPAFPLKVDERLVVLVTHLVVIQRSSSGVFLAVAARPDNGAAVQHQAVEPLGVVRIVGHKPRCVLPVGQGTITTIDPEDMSQWAIDCFDILQRFFP